jgi:hypothetical protein
LIESIDETCPQRVIEGYVDAVKATDKLITLGTELSCERLRIAVGAPLQEVAHAGCISKNQTGWSRAITQNRATGALAKVAQLSARAVPGVEIPGAHQRRYLFVTVAIQILHNKAADRIKVAG